MIIKTGFKVGTVTYQLEIEEKSELDTLHKAIVLSNPPQWCDECKNSDPMKFKMTSNKDGEGNTYVNVKCTACGATAKLGLYKSGGFFYHRFEKYVKKEDKKL